MMGNLHKIRANYYVTYVETREFSITDKELAEFRAGRCEDRCLDAENNDEGEFIESHTSDITFSDWELVEKKEVEAHDG